MADRVRLVLEQQPVSASAPCRVDVGGTLDIGVFYRLLPHLSPATFNIALDLRTSVRILPYTAGFVRVSSRGFAPAEYPLDEMPYNHPLGLMFALAAHFRIGGIHINIDSPSPPRSALGGSSAAAVALTAAFGHLMERSGKSGIDPEKIPVLAHAIEECTAGLACGCQDQLAAAYGGVNAWYWKGGGGGTRYERRRLLDPKDAGWLNARILVAYCGIPHHSTDINGEWIRRFLDGTHRRQWVDIVKCTNGFIRAFAEKDVSSAVEYMNRETAFRREMTPGVIDGLGGKLVASAQENGCAGRFAGAGGGGCIWALGEPECIFVLQPVWKNLLEGRKGAVLLDAAVDMRGVALHGCPDGWKREAGSPEK